MRGARYAWLDHVGDQVHGGALTWRASHVAYALAVHYADNRCRAWPSQPELAARTGLSRATVQRGLDELVQHNLLSVRKGPPAHTYGNVYTLQIPGPATPKPHPTDAVENARRRERQSVTA